MTAAKPLDLLYVEDSPADAEFLCAAFRKVAPEVTVSVQRSGPEALASLRKEGGWLPDMVLLDLKMPGMDGHEVLAVMKGDPELRHIPVIVLTSSRLQEDILRAYDVGANCYLAKPDDALGYTGIAKELHHFWAETAILPPEARP